MNRIKTKEEKNILNVLRKKLEIDFGIGVCDLDFETCFGRKPKDENEFLNFARLCQKGLEAQDWDIIYQCVREEMKK